MPHRHSATEANEKNTPPYDLVLCELPTNLIWPAGESSPSGNLYNAVTGKSAYLPTESQDRVSAGPTADLTSG